MKLIDIDAMGTILKKVKSDKYRVINLRDAGGHYYQTDMEEVLTSPHNLREMKPGTGIYLLTDDENILEEARSWITEVEPCDDKLVITKKDYFVLRTDESTPKAIKKIAKYYPKIYTDDNMTMYGNMPDDIDTKEGYLIDRYGILELEVSGFSFEELSKYIDVYTQRVDHLEKRSLVDALDIPRTLLNFKNIKYPKARRIILTYTYDPTIGIPVFLENGEICELEPVNISDDGNTIYKLSTKIISNMTNEEYKERMHRKNNKAVILLDGNLPSEIRTILERIYTGMDYQDILGQIPTKEYAKLCDRLGLNPILSEEYIDYIFGGEEGKNLIKGCIKELSEYPAGQEKLYVERTNVKESIPKMV